MSPNVNDDAPPVWAAEPPWLEPHPASKNEATPSVAARAPRRVTGLERMESVWVVVMVQVSFRGRGRMV